MRIAKRHPRWRDFRQPGRGCGFVLPPPSTIRALNQCLLMLRWTLHRPEPEGMREIMMRLRVVLAVLWTIVILVPCWTPQAFLPVNEGTESLTHKLHLDKLIHAGIFTVFTVLWLRTRPAGKTRYLWVLLAGTALAAITE